MIGLQTLLIILEIYITSWKICSYLSEIKKELKKLNEKVGVK